MKNLLLIITCFCYINTSLGQRYSGVNMNNIKLKRSKSQTQEVVQESHWQFLLGYSSTLGLQTANLDPDYLNMKNVYAHGLNLQLKVRKNWHKWSLQSQINVAHSDAKNPNSISIYENCLELLGLGIGGNYHWMRNEHWNIYSGIVGGYRWGRTTDLEQTQVGRRLSWIDYQITALGLNYNFNKWGGFLEVSYGTIDILNAGISYKLIK